MYLLGSPVKFWGSLMVVSWFEHLTGSQNLLHNFRMSDFCSGTAVLLYFFHILEPRCNWLKLMLLDYSNFHVMLLLQSGNRLANSPVEDKTRWFMPLEMIVHLQSKMPA